MNPSTTTMPHDAAQVDREDTRDVLCPNCNYVTTPGVIGGVRTCQLCDKPLPAVRVSVLVPDDGNRYTGHRLYSWAEVSAYIADIERAATDAFGARPARD